MSKKIYIALDNVRSLENVGAIMRTCSFFGINDLILIGYSGTTVNFKDQRVLHPTIKKTALGAELDLNIKIFESSQEFLDFIRNENISLFSVEQASNSLKLNTFDFVLLDNFCLVFGNERDGVNQEILEKSTSIIEIERLGNKNSLNVATSVGIVVSRIN